MSPWSIIAGTCRVTLKPLSLIAVVMGVIMLLPDSSSAAAQPPAETSTRADAGGRNEAKAAPPQDRTTRPAAPVSTILLAFDLGRLPASAFGDLDDAAR